ncbi:PH domain-containing protein [Epilithonimonas sp. JDS]|uniref:PH domain-containing protein n=1 Tax=Epilithonimonas sp. JDS TaxID=2902797 RepID=UPI001E2F28A5|nr:PH domain-containing protein [Epilithonimonas sp. JDS]MCD9853523.1 PH domain-containing protein [Epilithonimonas sp. JDS]
MKVYKSRRDWIYSSIYFIITILLCSSVISSFFDEDLTWLSWLIMVFISAGINILVLISFFFIKIKIKNEELIVNIIFDIFRINIFKITKIRIGETMWSGFNKCGTAMGGLIIFSKNKNDLYITPENQDEFLEELLKVNSHIIIENVRK